MSAKDAIATAVKAVIAEAHDAAVFTDDKTEIKGSTTKLANLLREWQARDKMVAQALSGLLKLVRQNCKHEGAQRGYNDRDGSWMNACPTCGHSE